MKLNNIAMYQSFVRIIWNYDLKYNQIDVTVRKFVWTRDVDGDSSVRRQYVSVLSTLSSKGSYEISIIWNVWIRTLQSPIVKSCTMYRPIRSLDFLSQISRIQSNWHISLFNVIIWKIDPEFCFRSSEDPFLSLSYRKSIEENFSQIFLILRCIDHLKLIEAFQRSNDDMYFSMKSLFLY